MVWEAKDDKIPFHKQYVSVAIIIINIIAFIIQFMDPTGYMYIYETAFIPSEFFAGKKIWTIITAMFMHGDIFHIIMNMWFFMVVADNCEKTMGHLLFLITYMVSGICASLLHAVVALLMPGVVNIPCLGASGAIFGIIAVYGILFPKNRLTMFSRFYVSRVKARTFMLYYFIIQIIYGMLLWQYSSTAYWAHIGGFIAGAIFAFMFKAVKGNKY